MTYYLKDIDRVLQALDGAYAPNTLKSYYADARAFVDWCGERNIEPFPMSSDTLCAYIEDLQQTAAYSTIRRRIASLRRLTKMLGFEDQTRTEEVYLAIRRLKRSKCLEQRQAVGINHDILVKMIAAQPDTLAGTRNRALLSLGYDTARRSELVAIRGDDQNSRRTARKGMIRKVKPTNTEEVGSCSTPRDYEACQEVADLKPAEIQPVFCDQSRRCGTGPYATVT